MKNKVSLMLDSGAFSAWSQGKPIDIDAYIQFIKENEKYIDHYINLDVIGDAENTYKNQKYIEKHGLNPIPVFHPMHEDDSWLARYIKEGYEYIGIGGMAGGTFNTSQLRPRLDHLFSKLICASDGMPKVKIHGFGMTSLDLMLRFPWFSVDSTSWVQTGRFGNVYVPKYRRGQYVYNENSLKVTVSTQSPSQKDDGQHFTTFSPMEQRQILDYFDSKGFIMGKSEYHKEDRKTYKLKENERWANSVDADSCRDLIENIGKYVPPEKLATKDVVEVVIEPGLSNDYKLRDELNIIYFLDLEDSMPKWPWPFIIKSNKGFAF